jgi:hypothetical protein
MIYNGFRRIALAHSLLPAVLEHVQNRQGQHAEGDEPETVPQGPAEQPASTSGTSAFEAMRR